MKSKSFFTESKYANGPERPENEQALALDIRGGLVYGQTWANGIWWDDKSMCPCSLPMGNGEARRLVDRYLRDAPLAEQNEALSALTALRDFSGRLL